MKAAAVLMGSLVWFSAASEESTNANQAPSVEILGVEITRGMPESEVRDALSNLDCVEEDPADPEFDFCSVSDDTPPGADGEITFRHGSVYSASRNWFIPDGAEPLEVLMMLNDLLTRLAGEENAACAKIETHSDQEPTYTLFVLPEKVLTVRMHVRTGRSGAFFKESLRVNAVPDSYRTRGNKMQGKDWCAYVN